MIEKMAEQALAFANQFVGKTIHAENDFDGRQFVAKSKEAAASHEWLYHCTNTDGLLGILKSREFWLTNLKNVNDCEEADRIDAPSYEKSYYVCCFSYDPNIPEEHWEEYGTMDNGVVIGVKRSWFLRKPVFMTTAHQKCPDGNMRIFANSHEALDYKIAKELNGTHGIDPYHIFDFDFYQVVYDDNLKKSIIGNCTINFGGTLIPGRSITQSIPGIIKSPAGWCERLGRKKYWKKWETEKEVRLKAGIHRLSKNDGYALPQGLTEPYFKQVAVPLADEAFRVIKIAFSPNFKDRHAFLVKIASLYPDSVIEIMN